MVTLTINTSTQPESIALIKDRKILGAKQWHGKMDETLKLLPAIAGLLKRFRLKFQDINRIIVASGPGGFSALRIGITVANTLAGILKIPLFQVATPDWEIPSLFARCKKVKVAAPTYSIPPNITTPKPRHV